MAGNLLPEAAAYAGLVRLPVVHGLMAAMVRLATYAVFGGRLPRRRPHLVDRHPVGR